MASRISSPDDSALRDLKGYLAARAAELDSPGAWPAEQLGMCAAAGVYEWFMVPAWGGQGWTEEQIVRGYLALSAGCLTTTFVITQRTGACRRIASGENQSLKERLLPDLAAGRSFATVGISHLTTSRRHVKRPVLTAERTSGGFLLNGMAPWVTGAPAADHVVIGATVTVDDEPTEEQILVALPTSREGVDTPAPFELVGVSASATGPVKLQNVELSDEWLVAGPTPNVMQRGPVARTGGVETSTLALGLAQSAIDFVADESTRRADLAGAAEALAQEHSEALEDLLSAARGAPQCSNESLRTRANSLVLRSAQASLAAAKGAGYVVGHPAGRWCREALFFLVWSCPQPVLNANLCELAGIAE